MKIGDIVYLRSGGPAMTVTGIYTPLPGNTQVAVAWIDAAAQPQSAQFNEACLVTKVVPESMPL